MEWQLLGVFYTSTYTFKKIPLATCWSRISYLQLGTMMNFPLGGNTTTRGARVVRRTFPGRYTSNISEENRRGLHS
jgi:hypothetical protein